MLVNSSKFCRYFRRSLLLVEFTLLHLPQGDFNVHFTSNWSRPIEQIIKIKLDGEKRKKAKASRKSRVGKISVHYPAPQIGLFDN